MFLLLDKNHTSHKRRPYFVVMLIYLPLTPQSDKGRMRYITIKGDSLSKIVLEDCSISFIVGVDVQDMLACRPNPFRRHWDEAEDEGLDTAFPFQSESLEFVLPHPILEHFIEVADEGGKQQEYGILVHERLGKAFPALHSVTFNYYRLIKVRSFIGSCWLYAYYYDLGWLLTASVTPWIS